MLAALEGQCALVGVQGGEDLTSSVSGLMLLDVLMLQLKDDSLKRQLELSRHRLLLQVQTARREMLVALTRSAG